MQTKENVTKPIISEIEEFRSNPLISCVWGCRRPFYTQPADDFIRYLVGYLDNAAIEKRKKVDIFLYGSGGTPEWALRVLGLIREYFDEVHAILPYTVGGAVALLALGCDRLVMGKNASLSTIDGYGYPSSITGTLQKDQPARYEPEKAAFDAIVRRMLTSRREKTIETQLRTIQAALSSSLSRDEVRAAGLPASTIKADLEESIWNLYKAYESSLKLRRPFQPIAEISEGDEKILGGLPLAVIESKETSHVFRADLQLRKIRHVAEIPNIEINLNLRMPDKFSEVSKTAGSAERSSAEMARRLKPKLEKTIREIVRTEWIRKTERSEITLEILKTDWEAGRPAT